MKIVRKMFVLRMPDGSLRRNMDCDGSRHKDHELPRVYLRRKDAKESPTYFKGCKIEPVTVTIEGATRAK